MLVVFVTLWIIEGKPNYQLLKVTKLYKHNAIIGHWHQSKRILMNFTEEAEHMKTKFLQANYQLPFLDSIITKFWSTMYAEDWFMSQSSAYLFEMLSWKYSCQNLNVGWIKMKACIPTNFTSP